MQQYYSIMLLSYPYWPQICSRTSFWIPAVWAGTHGIAVLSAYWSVKSGRHFPSDVWVGAIWGSSVAYLITQLHRSENKKLRIVPWMTSLQNEERTPAIGLSITFHQGPRDL